MKPASNLKLASMNAVRPALTRQPTVEKRRSSQRVLLRMPELAARSAAHAGYRSRRGEAGCHFGLHAGRQRQWRRRHSS